MFQWIIRGLTWIFLLSLYIMDELIERNQTDTWAKNANYKIWNRRCGVFTSVGKAICPWGLCFGVCTTEEHSLSLHLKPCFILSCGRKTQVALDSSSGQPFLHSITLDLGWHQFWHSWTFIAIVTQSTATLYLFTRDVLDTCLIGGPLMIWIIGISGNTSTICTACRWVKHQLYLGASRCSWWLISTFTFL